MRKKISPKLFKNKKEFGSLEELASLVLFGPRL